MLNYYKSIYSSLSDINLPFAYAEGSLVRKDNLTKSCFYSKYEMNMAGDFVGRISPVKTAGGIMGKKDITLKDYLSDGRRYADLVNGSIFQGRQVIRGEMLTDANAVQAKSEDKTILERTNDIVMKQTADGKLFAVWVVANQEHIDYTMPVRVMLQESLEYDRQLKEIKRQNRKNAKMQSKENKVFQNAAEFLSGIRREDRLQPVVTLVVYWGKEKWQGHRTFMTL